MIEAMFGLFAFLGVLFGWIAFFRTQDLRQDIRRLQNQVQRLQDGNATENQGPVPGPAAREPRITPEPEAAKAAPATRRPPPQPLPPPPWLEHLKQHWMVWLGGACIGLAGIFLARYSIEQGYLGPGARVTGGILLGLALHGAAEWLRRHREPHAALAGLAAGGSITLFAALLAALHLYQLMSPWVVFTGLSLVALVTMALAVWHGPILAIIGILGAYLVPVLIGGQAGNAVSACIYALIISASALVLMRFVYRPWLWVGMLAGGLFWWAMTWQEPGMDILGNLYLAGLAYLMLAIPGGDYLLVQKRPAKGGDFTGMYLVAAETRERPLPVSLFVIFLIQCLAIANDGFGAFALVKYSPLSVLVLLAGSRRGYLRLHPWVLLLALLAGLLLAQLANGAIVPLSGPLAADFYWYCLLTAVLFSGLSLFHFRFIEATAVHISMAAITPVLFLGLSYALTTDLSRSAQWGLLAIVLSGFYFVLTRITWSRRGGDTTLAWLLIAGHFAYSLGVAMLLRQASMTLALAAQVITLAWVVRRFELKETGWILKGIVALVVFRLTLNPWLVQYPTDIHWSLWTYGGATLCCLAGALLLKGREDLERWTWVAVIHLFALTLWAETRYWLYDGSVYAREYSFREAAINTGLFGLLGLVYHYRVKTSVLLAPWYRFYSNLLILFALGNYTLILGATFLSASWAWSEIGETPIANFMLIAYGFPIVPGLLYYRFYDRAFRKWATLFTAASAFIFVSLEVRHLWQGTVSLRPSASDGELYTYSAVWLAIAVAAILGGVWRYGATCYKGGMLLLALVIAKLFLVDMSGLEGLLRVASFMGMGLGLLGIAYLHQRLQRGNTAGH